MELSSQYVSGSAMMERSQPSLLELLVPNSATALNYPEKKQQQQQHLAALPVTFATNVAERSVSALPSAKVATRGLDASQTELAAAASSSTARAEKAPVAAAAAPIVFRDTALAFGAHGSIADEKSRVSSALGGSSGDRDEDEESEVTASSKATLSLVSRRYSTLPSLPRPMASEAAAAAASSPVSGSSAAAATDAELTVACSPVRRRSTMFITPFATSAADSFHSSRRRSTAVSASLVSDERGEEEEEEHAMSPAPRRPRRSTLAGGSDSLGHTEAASPDAADDDEGNCFFVSRKRASSATLSTAVAPAYHVRERKRLSQSGQVGNDVPVSDYISNLFTSFALGVYNENGRDGVTVLSAAGSTSSQASSACPSPVSQRRRPSLKMCSTTLAPISNACNSNTSNASSATAAPTPPAAVVRGLAQGYARRASHASLLSAPYTSDGMPRAPRVTFLPEGRASGVPVAFTSAPTPAAPCKASTLPTSCSDAGAATDATDDEGVHLADTVMGMTLDTTTVVAALSPDPTGKHDVPATDANSLDTSTTTQHFSTSAGALALPGVARIVAAPLTRPPSSYGGAGASAASGGRSRDRRFSSASSMWSATEESHNRVVTSASVSTAVGTAPPSEKLRPCADGCAGMVTRSVSNVSEVGCLRQGSEVEAAASTVGDSSFGSVSELLHASEPAKMGLALRWSRGGGGGAVFGGVARLYAAVAQYFRRAWMWVTRAALRFPLRSPRTAAEGAPSACSATTPPAQSSDAVAGAGKRMMAFHALRQHLDDAPTIPAAASTHRSGTLGNGKPGVVVGSSFSETLHLSFPLSQSSSLTTVEQEGWRRMAPSSQVVTDLQQTLRDTWSGGGGGCSNAWFSSDAQQEPRTALRSTGRILRTQSADHSCASPQMQPSSPPRGVGFGGEDGSVLRSRGSTSPSSPHLSFAESFAVGREGVSGTDVFHRGTLLAMPRGLQTSGSNGSLTRRSSPSVEQPVSFSRMHRSAPSDATVPPRSAILDDEYRAQLYHEFRHPPSCCIGDFGGCVAAYTAMVETSSVGHHVMNWKELSLLLAPEDLIDYRDLFPPYHFVTFADFVEFVEVLSVRHRV